MEGVGGGIRLRICLIEDLSIMFAPYHTDLRSLPLLCLDPAQYLLPSRSVRVEKVRTSPFLIPAYPFFFCSPMKRNVEVWKEGEETKEKWKERDKGRRGVLRLPFGKMWKETSHRSRTPSSVSLSLSLSLSLFFTIGFVHSLDILNQIQIENHFVFGASN